MASLMPTHRSPFTPASCRWPGARASARRHARAHTERRALLRAGIIAGGVPSPEFLRTCPCCDSGNQARYGETYWHRLHQLTGIQVCPIHQVFLEDTDARRRHARTRHGFVAAQESHLTTAARPINPDDPHHQCLLRLACAAQWALRKCKQRPFAGIITIAAHPLWSSLVGPQSCGI